MDYAHHNLQLHHFDFNSTYNSLVDKFWWGTMKKDVRKFCATCLSCQYAKGTVRHRAPLRVRNLPNPREHLFADFLGPIFSEYNILVLIDYATGYTILAPTHGQDAVTIVETILRHWIPIFGWFKVFESDWGSGFNSHIMKALTKASGVNLELAEPRNHRSIGKVERVIGFIQSILNHYNLLLEQKLTDDIHNFAHSWDIIETLLPFIQMSINQRLSPISLISPNMLMFGTNVKDISDTGRVKANIIEYGENNKSMKKQDYQYVYDLAVKLDLLQKAFEQQWRDKTWLSRTAYNTKWRITGKKIENYLKTFAVGKEVLYFVGDKQVARRKWRRKWTGPWRVAKHLNDSTLIIENPENGDQKRVSFDRIKRFVGKDLIKYKELIGEDYNYVKYQEYLSDILTNYDADVREQEFNLDYTQN